MRTTAYYHRKTDWDLGMKKSTHICNKTCLKAISIMLSLSLFWSSPIMQPSENRDEKRYRSKYIKGMYLSLIGKASFISSLSFSSVLAHTTLVPHKANCVSCTQYSHLANIWCLILADIYLCRHLFSWIIDMADKNNPNPGHLPWPTPTCP